MRQLLYTIFASIALIGVAVPEKANEAVTLQPEPFIDNFRWHQYHLTKETPVSEDGVFRLLSIAKNGDVRLRYLDVDRVIVLKRSASTKEIMDSKMPMRIVSSDYESQSTVFEWLTTN